MLIENSSLMGSKVEFDLSQVWDLEEHTLICDWNGHSKPVIKLHELNHLLFSTAGLEIKVWDVESYACLCLLETCEGSGSVRSLSVSAMGSFWPCRQLVRNFITQICCGVCRFSTMWSIVAAKIQM